MTSRRNVRLVLSYDGTALGGWQRQSNARSVQQDLEAALATMHGHEVPTIGAGRTDAGVHALGQVANFYTDIASIPPERFVPALNGLMSGDIRVLEAREADWDFHSRYDARMRRYRYYCLCGGPKDPFRLRYAQHLGRRPDLDSLNAMAALILGERDFTAFSSAGDASANRSRFVHEASFRWEGDMLVFEVAANAFLWRMVRSLVGSILYYEEESRRALGEDLAARRAMCAARMLAALSSRDRRLAGPTAPARGLFLWNVEYYPRPTRPGRGDYWVERGSPGPGKSDGKEGG